MMFTFIIESVDSTCRDGANTPNSVNKVMAQDSLMSAYREEKLCTKGSRFIGDAITAKIGHRFDTLCGYLSCIIFC